MILILDFFHNQNHLQFCPDKVEGDFYCAQNKLTNLEGSPETVEGYFWCYNNELTSLEGAPKKIGGGFDCEKNPKLKSLLGAPECKKVISDFAAKTGKNYLRFIKEYGWDKAQVQYKLWLKLFGKF